MNAADAFPEEVARRLIRMFSFPGETVLDPFAGSGMTALAARHLERDSIGFVQDRRLRSIIARRLIDPQISLFGPDCEVEFIE